MGKEWEKRKKRENVSACVREIQDQRHERNHYRMRRETARRSKHVCKKLGSD
jgi:hypothetical protein